jgi:hypothetical protein
MNRTSLLFNLLIKKLKVILLLVLFIFTIACTKSNDKPPRIDTPIPQSHSGVYQSNDATFTFNGDGKTVLVYLSDRYLELLDNPLNNTEYFYTFTWYDFGEYRYDGATNIILYHEDTKTSINFSLYEASSYERIILSFPIPDKENQVLEWVSD